MSKITIAEILKLSVDERLELIEQIWDTIGADPLTEEDLEELDRRLAGADANPEVGQPWAEVKAGMLVPE
jgi:putative addiction module component (TIGR02574 family)